jgi:hypothetical protein
MKSKATKPTATRPVSRKSSRIETVSADTYIPFETTENKVEKVTFKEIDLVKLKTIVDYYNESAEWYTNKLTKSKLELNEDEVSSYTSNLNEINYRLSKLVPMLGEAMDQEYLDLTNFKDETTK